MLSVTVELIADTLARAAAGEGLSPAHAYALAICADGAAKDARAMEDSAVPPAARADYDPPTRSADHDA